MSKKNSNDEKRKYKVTGYKLISFESLSIESNHKFSAKRQLISLMKKGKIKVKSENYFVEVEPVK
jgi:competence CoiA-like predicted nuclease